MKNYVCIFTCVALLSACSMNPQLSRTAIDHNELVANTANSITLMNILRARDRLPTHYTGVSSLTGSASLEAAPTANITLLQGGSENSTEGLGVKATASSNFNVSVYDTKKFYQGVTASIPKETILNFLDQGWPADVLTLVVTNSVEISVTKASGPFEKGRVLASFDNDPREGKTKIFQAFFNCYWLGAIYEPREERWIAPVSPAAAASDKLYADVMAGKIMVIGGIDQDMDRKAKDQASDPVKRFDGVPWYYRRAGAERVLGLVPRKESGCSQGLSFDQAVPSGIKFTLKEGDSGKLLASIDGHVIDGKPLEVEVAFEARLRSTESAIYYLGEYVRTPNTLPRLSKSINGNLVDGPLISVVDTVPTVTFVSTKYKGERYFVGALRHDDKDDFKKYGRSTQTFTLLQQLINLQKESDDRPSTGTVRILP